MADRTSIEWSDAASGGVTADRTVRRTDWTGGEIRAVIAPGVVLPAERHAHLVPGVWDDDNGPAAGRVCLTCWQANRPVNLDAALAARWTAEHADHELAASA